MQTWCDYLVGDKDQDQQFDDHYGPVERRGTEPHAANCIENRHNNNPILREVYLA